MICELFNCIVIIALMLLLFFSTGCVATAPISIAWRSNAHQQYATTDGKNDEKSGSDQVNADRMTETQAAVTTSSGTAQTTGKQDAAKDGSEKSNDKSEQTDLKQSE